MQLHTLMLRPMHTGASGYTRVQNEHNHTCVQVHARGLPAGEARLFWLTGDGAAREAACAPVNANGECTLPADAPDASFGTQGLKALIILSGGDAPKPLLVTLCPGQNADGMLSARSAALALCEKLTRRAPEVNAAQPVQSPTVQPPAEKPKAPPPAPPLPRDVFLPAITAHDLPQVQVEERKPSPKIPDLDRGQINGAKPLKPQDKPPAEQRKGAKPLKPLRWPRDFESLKPYFDQGLPCRILDAPGWRFVNAAQGLWVGRKVLDGRVCGVAYAARPGTLPVPGQTVQGVDGSTWQVLWQHV